jgi:hypothetical protein
MKPSQLGASRPGASGGSASRDGPTWTLLPWGYDSKPINVWRDQARSVAGLEHGGAAPRELRSWPMVTFIIGGEFFEISDERAEQIAVNLRSAAAMKIHDKRGVEAGRPLADAIELRLVGERDDAILVEGEQAWALFQDLNMTAPTPDDSLYLAVRAFVEAV